MKKTISLLLVVLLASACLFADVSLTGELGFGYKVNFNGTVENKDYLNLGSTYGGRFKIKLASDYVNGELRMDAISVDPNVKDPAWNQDNWTITTGVRQPINAYATVKASKLVEDTFSVSLPVAVELYVGNQSFSTSYNWAYLDPQDNEHNIALNAPRSVMPIGASVSYDKYVTVSAWGSFTTGSQKGLVEAKVSPVDGIRAAVAYGINQAADKNNFQAAALVDVKTLADLDFDLAVSGQIIANVDDFAKGAYYATVAGGYKSVSGFAEFIRKSEKNNLYAGLSYALPAEKAPTTLSAGLALENLDDAKVGASVGATTQLSNITLNVKLGVDNFKDFKNSGYVRFASYITF